jgi:hypothetical protein
VARSCEDCNEPSDSIKDDKFLDQYDYNNNNMAIIHELDEFVTHNFLLIYN